jgi:hypothetical protein
LSTLFIIPAPNANRRLKSKPRRLAPLIVERAHIERIFGTLSEGLRAQ